MSSLFAQFEQVEQGITTPQTQVIPNQPTQQPQPSQEVVSNVNINNTIQQAEQVQQQANTVLHEVSQQQTKQSQTQQSEIQAILTLGAWYSIKGTERKYEGFDQNSGKHRFSRPDKSRDYLITETDLVQSGYSPTSDPFVNPHSPEQLQNTQSIQSVSQQTQQTQQPQIHQNPVQPPVGTPTNQTNQANQSGTPVSVSPVQHNVQQPQQPQHGVNYQNHTQQPPIQPQNNVPAVQQQSQSGNSLITSAQQGYAAFRSNIALIDPELASEMDSCFEEKMLTNRSKYPQVVLEKCTFADGTDRMGFRIEMNGVPQAGIEELTCFVIYKHGRRAIYPSGSKPGSNTPPLCYSENGTHPYGGEFFSKDCRSCPYNEYESARAWKNSQDPKEGKGKACPDRYRLYLFIPKIGVRMLDAPPTSNKVLEVMFGNLDVSQIPYPTVKVQFTLESIGSGRSMYGKLKTQLLPATQEEMIESLKMRKEWLPQIKVDDPPEYPADKTPIFAGQTQQTQQTQQEVYTPGSVE